MPLYTNPNAIIHRDFVFQQAPFKSCHASTIEETKAGLVVAWFGGTAEGKPDVCIWLSRQKDGQWTKPVKVEIGRDTKGKRQPCWNPVLFQPKKGPLMLFYKVGPNPTKWWGMMATSTDSGLHWSAAKRLPNGILGPIKNRPMQLANGDILCPTSAETERWRISFDRTPDLGKTWTTTGPVNDGLTIQAIQPSLLRASDGSLVALGRTKQNHIFQIDSRDGKHWGPMSLTTLPIPNSGIDATTLSDGRQVVVYNHDALKKGAYTAARSPLNVAVSPDLRHWNAVFVLEKEEKKEFSYPSVIQTSDGKIHIVYTWMRKRIKHVVLDPNELEGPEIVDGVWPRMAKIKR